jgi:hypothetical protein
MAKHLYFFGLKGYHILVFFLKKRKKLYDILRGEIISEFFKNNKNMSLHLINYSLIP